jgi:hypothetical protein
MDRLLTAMVVHNKCTLKQGDCKFAFIQATLPDGELTICSTSSWMSILQCAFLLEAKKSLYGLHWAPRHWYTLFSNVLQSPEIGLHPTKHDPCIFHGTIIPGNSPLYVAYVNDFILAWRMRLNITLRPPYPRSLLSIFWVRQSNFLAENSIGQITLASPRRGMQLLLWRRRAYLQLTNHPR